MTIIENKLKEFKDVTFDKLRVTGSFAPWQRKLYNYITVKLEPIVLEKMVMKVNDVLPKIVPEGTDHEEIKETIKLSLLDYVDSVF